MTFIVSRGSIMEQEEVYEKQIRGVPTLALIQHLEREASFHELASIAKAARRGMQSRYAKKRRRRIRGNLPVTMNTEQVLCFFGDRIVKRRKTARIAFLRMLFYGARPSDVCNMRIVENQNIVCIYSEKMDRAEYLPLIPGTEKLFSVEIAHSPAYLAKVFRMVRERNDMSYRYGEATDGRPLYQYTTHSFRHTAGNLLFKYTGSEYKMHVFLRHETVRLFGATGHYLRYDLDDMCKDLNACFGHYVELLL